MVAGKFDTEAAPRPRRVIIYKHKSGKINRIKKAASGAVIKIARAHVDLSCETMRHFLPRQQDRKQTEREGARLGEDPGLNNILNYPNFKQ